MTETNVSGIAVTIESSRGKSRVPPFGIIDLMALTGAMALVFALKNWFDLAGWVSHTEARWYKFVEYVLFCLRYGLPTAALFRFVLQKLRVGRFLLAPGHWLLLAAFLPVAGNALSSLALALNNSEPGMYIVENNAVWFFLPNTICGLLAILIMIRGAFAMCKSWKCVFVLVALTYLCSTIRYGVIYATMISIEFAQSAEFAFSCVAWIGNGLNGLLCLWLLFLVIKELMRGPQRDFWHWIGVWLVCLNSFVLPLVNWIYVTYLFDPSMLNP